jgi:hypothetical protein
VSLRGTLRVGGNVSVEAVAGVLAPAANYDNVVALGTAKANMSVAKIAAMGVMGVSRPRVARASSTCCSLPRITGQRRFMLTRAVGLVEQRRVSCRTHRSSRVCMSVGLKRISSAISTARLTAS